MGLYGYGIGVVLALSKCHPCFVHVKIMCIFVAICCAELFWHTFGYIDSVRLQYLLQRNKIKI